MEGRSNVKILDDLFQRIKKWKGIFFAGTQYDKETNDELLQKYPGDIQRLQKLATSENHPDKQIAIDFLAAVEKLFGGKLPTVEQINLQKNPFEKEEPNEEVTPPISNSGRTSKEQAQLGSFFQNMKESKDKNIYLPLFERMKQWESIFNGSAYTTEDLARLIKDWSTDKQQLMVGSKDSRYEAKINGFFELAMSFFKIKNVAKLPTMQKGQLVVDKEVDSHFQEKLSEIQSFKQQANDLLKRIQKLLNKNALDEKDLATLQSYLDDSKDAQFLKTLFDGHSLDLSDYQQNAQEKIKSIMLLHFTTATKLTIAELKKEKTRIHGIDENDPRLQVLEGTIDYGQNELQKLSNQTAAMNLQNTVSAIAATSNNILTMIDDNLIKNTSFDHNRRWYGAFGKFIYNTFNLFTGFFVAQKLYTAAKNHSFSQSHYGFYSLKTNCTQRVIAIRKNFEDSISNKR